jgi:RNA polymerase sigma-70 factor, ECF subfamily
MTELLTEQPNAHDRRYSGASVTPSVKAKHKAVDGSLQREIEALIPRLRRYARVLTRDAVAADDLVQDCLARALGKLSLWEEGTDLRAWLFTILYHQHVSQARRGARHLACIQSQYRSASSTLPPPQAVRLELRDLERALARLPEEQRSLILLVGLEGMPYEEAASVVNLPVGTVRSRVSRGRQTLRAMTGLFPTRHSPAPESELAPKREHLARFLKERNSGSRSRELVQ